MHPRSRTTIEVGRVHFNVRLRSVLVPITFNDLLPVFTEIGYIADQRLVSQSRSLPGGILLSIAGEIAKSKDGTSAFMMQADRGIFGFQCTSVEGVLKDFDAFERTVTSLLSVDIKAESQFYEFILDAEARVAPDRNPLLELERFWEGCEELKGITKIVGFDVGHFGMRLIRRGDAPSGLNWREFKIEPSILKPRTHYSVNIVHRDEERDKVVAQANTALDTAGDILDSLSIR